MALPTFQAAGTLTGSTAAISPPWPTHAVDDVALMFVETANQIPTALTTANGFVFVGTLSYGGGTAGSGATASSLDVYWCRATSTSMAAPTVTDAGQHTIGQILTFSGCITTGDPWDVYAGDASGSATTSVTIPGVTTTVADCLVVLACSWADDSASGFLASVTNASLANITSLVNAGNISGNGGGFAVLTGEMATAGAVSSSTGTLTGSASYQGRACIALKPPAAAGVTGDLSATLGAATLASTGTLAIAGALSATLGAATLASTSTLGIAGDLSQTLGAATLSATGTLAIDGGVSATLGDATLSATGTLAIAGALSQTLGTMSLSSTATAPQAGIVGELAATLGALSMSAAATIADPAPPSTTTTTPRLRALLIANIAAIDAQGSPGFRVYRHDQAAAFTDWCDANPAGAFRRYSVRDYGFDTLESVNQGDLEWRRVQLRITVAYPHTNRAGAQGAVSRDALMRIDRHAIEVATGLRAYVSLETLPAVYLSSRASKALGTACDFLVIDAVYGFFATPV